MPAGTFPDVGDANGYYQKGDELFSTARTAVSSGSDAQGAQMQLLLDGVAVAQDAAGNSRIAQVAMSTIAAGVAGFAVGGPIGAAAGVAESLLQQALAGQELTPGVVFTPSGADAAVYRRIMDWNAKNILPDPSGAPVGWALYDYGAQVPIANGGLRQPGHISVCTPYLWLQNPINYGCVSGGSNAGSFDANGDDPLVQQHYYGTLTLAITGSQPPGMTTDQAIQYAISRAPDQRFFDVSTQLVNVGLENAFPLPKNLSTLLSLATVFGMLQAGASDRSIASELLVQRYFHAETDTPSLSQWSTESQGMTDAFVARAKQSDALVRQHGSTGLQTPTASNGSTASSSLGVVVGGAITGALSYVGLAWYFQRRGMTVGAGLRRLVRRR